MLFLVFLASWLISPHESSLLGFIGILDLCHLMGINLHLAGENQTNALVIKDILTQVRLPRTLVVLLSGASLALAGALSQGIFRNSLASPSVVGSQSGGVLFAVIGFSLAEYYHWPVMIPVLTILGCMLAHSLISGVFYYFSGRGGIAGDDLVILGFAIHLFLGGLTTMFLSFNLADVEKSLAILKWLFGSYAMANWSDVWLMMITMTLGGVIAFSHSRDLDVFSLSNDEARSLSLNTERLRQIMLFGISVLIGGSVASAGGIPFVGLMAPHIARLFVGGNHQWLFRVSLIIGPILTLLCDTIARSLRYPEELETGIILTILGGPFFIFLLWRKRTSALTE
ncbi:MAG: iron ABC transporter permease [Proteobacteria bacterium]|nr:iron ABC transporter permease [Pseudomonadota bacterium]